MLERAGFASSTAEGYLQTAGITRVDGQLAVSDFTCLGGTIKGTGSILASGGVHGRQHRSRSRDAR